MEKKEISKAIIAVMTEVNNIGKNTTVWEWRNAYKAVSDKDVKEAIRTSMWKNWLCIMSTWIQSKIQIDRWEEDDTYNKQAPYPKKTKQSVFTEVESKYLLLHTSWESIELAWYGQWVDTQDKGAGKATTYALKNVLINLFLVPTGEDTDNTHSDSYAVPKTKTEKQVYKWKLDVMDYVTRVKEEDDVNALDSIYKEFIAEWPSEKQKEWLIRECKERKEQLINL
jgi:hypothetical protein